MPEHKISDSLTTPEPRLMKQVRLIRHGQSAANAGEASVDHATIPLTLRGVEQAQLVALSFTHAPDLIVFSSASNRDGDRSELS